MRDVSWVNSLTFTLLADRLSISVTYTQYVSKGTAFKRQNILVICKIMMNGLVINVKQEAYGQFYNVPSVHQSLPTSLC